MSERAGSNYSRRRFLGGAAGAVAGTVAGVGYGAQATAAGQTDAECTLPCEPSVATTYAGYAVTGESAFFSTAYAEEYSIYNTSSKGDLWPSCWAPDDNVYAANGDGSGFSPGPYWDVAVSVIRGTPPNLSGETLAHSDAVGSVWSTATRPDGTPLYNRKPTGMVCVDGVLYLALQDLNRSDFSDAPNASISRSVDLGKTWTWGANAPHFDDGKGPMFSGHLFTTIMFLDFGKNSEHAIDDHVYAYGLDYNWRQSYSHRYPNPQALFLGRVPKTSVQDRSAWEFFVGFTRDGKPAWSRAIRQKAPVLEDFRCLYQASSDPGQRPQTVISQGSVVYNQPLGRYLYTSWTEYTFEFYEAPAPWGPWSRFHSKDFGKYPWTATKNGGYATTLFTKWMSTDGKTMWLNANNFGHSADNYHLSLRRLTVEPYRPSQGANPRDAAANLAMAPGTVPVCKNAHNGNVAVLNDGLTAVSENSSDQELKTEDWWGYVWPRTYTLDTVVYTTGDMAPDGGWFGGRLRVQVRQRRETSYQWVDVMGLEVDPPFPFDSSAGPRKAYTFTFDAVEGDGVRVIGTPALAASAGGQPVAATYTSICELAVYHR